MLGLGMDEMDEDEDEKIEINGIPFVADDSFLLKYGRSFDISFNNDKQVMLTALES